jgi:hypothetical protein
MADVRPTPQRLVPAKVAVLAKALGIPIASERLPEVTVVLTELFALEAVLDELDLAGVDPDMDDVQWLIRSQ